MKFKPKKKDEPQNTKEEVKEEKPKYPEGFDPSLPEQKQRWLRQ